jgi:hypothetical protein
MLVERFHGMPDFLKSYHRYRFLPIHSSILTKFPNRQLTTTSASTLQMMWVLSSVLFWSSTKRISSALQVDGASLVGGPSLDDITRMSADDISQSLSKVGAGLGLGVGYGKSGGASAVSPPSLSNHNNILDIYTASPTLRGTNNPPSLSNQNDFLDIYTASPTLRGTN